MQQLNQTSEFSLIVDTAKLDREGETLSLLPTEAERAAIAERLNLGSLSHFSGEAVVSPWGRGGWQVEATFAAIVEQECVVTLEPVENQIEDGFLVRYLPEKALAVYDQEEEVMLGEVMEEDPPELLPSDGIDVGELAVEYLSLSLDPYPRKPEASKSLQSDDNPAEIETKENPFAVLSKLKKVP